MACKMQIPTSDVSGGTTHSILSHEVGDDVWMWESWPGCYVSANASVGTRSPITWCIFQDEFDIIVESSRGALLLTFSYNTSAMLGISWLAHQLKGRKTAPYVCVPPHFQFVNFFFSSPSGYR
jgi:hypothetical protein